MLVMVNQYEEKDNCKRAKRDFEKLKENLLIRMILFLFPTIFFKKSFL